MGWLLEIDSGTLAGADIGLRHTTYQLEDTWYSIYVGLEQARYIVRMQNNKRIKTKENTPLNRQNKTVVRQSKADHKQETMQHPGWVLNATTSRSIPTWYFMSLSLTTNKYVACFKSHGAYTCTYACITRIIRGMNTSKCVCAFICSWVVQVLRLGGRHYLLGGLPKPSLLQQSAFGTGRGLATTSWIMF